MIETERLILKPLTYSQLVKYLRADGSLEKELGLREVSRIISSDLQEALEQTILPNTADDSKNYLYSTLWTIILKNEAKMIGDLCFIGEPNGNGEIELGYGTYDQFRNMGFMTEAVGGIIEWVRTQSKIKSIIAFTNQDNVASFKVLLKNNFLKADENETSFKWILLIRS